MDNLNTQNIYNKPHFISFRGNFVLKKAGLINRIKLDYLAGKAIYQHPQNNLSKINHIELFINTIFNALNPHLDMYCLVNQKKKIVAGFSGYKDLMFYIVNTMYVDKSIRNKKDSIKCLKAMADKIKERAERLKKPLISCFVAKKNKPAQRLYKKMNLEADSQEANLITMSALTKDFGKNIPDIIKRLKLQ